MLGEICSDASVDLLLKLTEITNEEIKKAVLTALVRISNSDSTKSELKAKIRDKLSKIAEKGEWIVA